MSFPTPVGGIALPDDFAPSILFAVLYGCLIPLILYRQFHRRSWNVILIGCISFSIERIVIFSLRAVQSHNERRRESTGLLKYMQLTIGLGFITISQDVVNLVRCILVNATFGTETLRQAPAYAGAKRASCGSQEKLEDILAHRPILQVVTSKAPVADAPRLRFWMRRFTDIWGLAFLAAVVPGMIAGLKYDSVVNDPSKGGSITALRYVSTAVVLALNFVLMGLVIWATIHLERVDRSASRLVLTATSLLNIVAVYRLAVMSNSTTSLDSLGSGSLNSRAAKAMFYLFHILPEWSCILLLFGVNTREICGTGPWGDWRGQDETKKEREKREKKKALRAAKRAEKEACRESAELRHAQLG